MLLSLVVAIVALVAAIAFVRAQMLARRVERLSRSYWELRYEHSALRARVARLDAPGDLVDPAPSEPPPTTFVPLASLKKG